MKLIDTNKLNRFWKNGVKPIAELVAQKLDKSKIANNLLTTIEGYTLDARQGKVLQDEVDEINSNLNELKTGLTKWKYLGHLTGAGSITSNKLTPPQGYKEFLIISTATSSQIMPIIIPAGASGWFSGSYYITGSDNAFYNIGIQASAIWLGVAYKNGGTNVTDATQADVYYR